MKHVKYFFHPYLDIQTCNGGVLAVSIFGNKISIFDDSLDEDFSHFILKYKNHQDFRSLDIAEFFPNKKYNTGNIIQQLEERGLIIESYDSKSKPKQDCILLINLSKTSDKEIIEISKELNFKSELIVINNLDYKSEEQKSIYKKIDEIKSKLIFVLGNPEHIHKMKDINLHLFDKGLYWCPVVIDEFGGYIGPLLHSTPTGPCFHCYEKTHYPSEEITQKNKVKALWEKVYPKQQFNFSILHKIFLRALFVEIFKMDTNLIPSQTIFSNLIELDCLNYRSRKHYIYPDRNCSVCGV